MGHRYLKGIGVPEDCPTAVSFLEVAANTAAEQISRRGFGLFVDRTHLSDHVDTRYRKEVDEEVRDLNLTSYVIKLITARVRYTLIVSNQFMNVLHFCTKICLNDLAVSLQVVHYYQQLAEEGDDAYAAMLGNLFLQGSRLVDQDLSKAEYYLRLAADRAHVHCSAQLGYLMAQGKVKGDAEKALKLLEYAKGYRDIVATLGLAYCSFKGVGVPRNDSKAFETFRSIAGTVIIICASRNHYVVFHLLFVCLVGQTKFRTPRTTWGKFSWDTGLSEEGKTT